MGKDHGNCITVLREHLAIWKSLSAFRQNAPNLELLDIPFVLLFGNFQHY